MGVLRELEKQLSECSSSHNQAVCVTKNLTPEEWVFCWIGIHYAVLSSQKYTPPHCFFYNFSISSDGYNFWLFENGGFWLEKKIEFSFKCWWIFLPAEFFWDHFETGLQPLNLTFFCLKHWVYRQNIFFKKDP